MREVAYGKKFVKSYKRISRSGNFDKSELEIIVDILTRNVEIPTRYHDHALTGDFAGVRELHLRGNLLVLYKIEEDGSRVRFTNIGSHANLFGM
jgi:mRNA interferase YafQ